MKQISLSLDFRKSFWLKLPYTFTDENWKEQPLYTMRDDEMLSCLIHGEYCPNAYYGRFELSEMLADGYVECPLCMAEIVGI